MPEVRKMPSGPRGNRYMGPGGKFNKKSFKRLLKYLFKYKWLFFIVVTCILINSIVEVQSQLFLQTLIDDYITPLVNSINPVYTSLIKFLLFMAFIYLIGVLASFIYNRIMMYISQGVLKNIRDDMFNHMESLPIRYFDENTRGDIMSRYTNDTDTLRQMIGQSIPQLLTSVFSIAAIFISMLTLNIYLTFLVIIGIIIMTSVSKKIVKKSGTYFLKGQESLGELNGYIEEMVNGSKVVKVFTHEEKSKEDFDKLNEKLFKYSAKANSYGNIMGPINNNIGNLIYVIIAFVGGLIAIYTKSFTLGGVAAFLTLTKHFTMPIMQITQQFNSIVLALAGAERIFSLMDEKKEENNGNTKLVYVKNEDNKLIKSNKYTGLWAWDNNENLTLLEGNVNINNITFGYIKEKIVIHNISITAKKGQKIALVGATGAGKTTIINLLNCFYDLNEGNITYDGIDIKNINKNDLRKSLGMVLQDTNLFTGTIMENIRYGRNSATDKDCINAAKLANADDFIKLFPDGYNTIITGNGNNLSQGQRQLLAFARCAVSNPPVMILDEATSSIDTRTEKMIQDGMDKLMKGRTVFIIAHRLSTVHNADVIIVLDHGKVIECGNHEKLIKEKGKYYELYTGNFELD